MKHGGCLVGSHGGCLNERDLIKSMSKRTFYLTMKHKVVDGF